MFSFLIVPLILAASVFSMPALQTRQTSSTCAATTTSYNFTLAALSVNGPNANDTGVPLVLGWGPPGTSAAASAWVLSTYASWGSNEWPYISLENGALLPQPGSSEHGLGAYNQAVDSGEEIIFEVTTAESSPETADVFCAVSDSNYEYAILAVNGDNDNFSLCTATTTSTSGNSQINLVYEPVAGNANYDYDTCYSVILQMVPY